MAHRLATAGWWATPIVAVQLSFVETRGDPRRPCDLDFVARSSQGKPLSFFPSCLPLSPEGNIFIFFSSHPTQSIEKAVVSSTGAGPPFPSHFFFTFSSLSPLTATALVTLLPNSPNHAPSSNTPHLAFPRFRLDPLPQSGLRCTRTRTPQIIHEHTLPSPGRRKSAQSDSGLSDGAGH